MEKCIVVIPIHNSKPTHFELISFIQCFNVIQSSKIVILHPEGLDLTVFKKYIPTFQTISIKRSKMSSILAYNKLKLSKYFYDLFTDYEYLLTYELDAFIFKDDINYWCSLELDYIGAPWLIHNCDDYSLKLVGVGNSGFSLRKIKTMKRFIKNYIRYPMVKPKGIWNKLFIKIILFTYYLFPFIENITIQYFCDENEDIVISNYCSLVLNDFKMATINQALDFSFECYPEYLHSINKNKLPMGCHAWWKYNLDFWKPFINQQGYKI
jgi:hypothetical protein